MSGKIDQAPYFAGNGTPQGATVSALGVGGGGPFVPQRELGKVYTAPDGKRWQKVQAAGTLTHAAAKKEIAYWSATKMIVDTDLTDSVAGENSVAGMFLDSTDTVLPTASQYFWILQEAISVTVSSIQVNMAANAKVVASTTVGKVTCTVQGTAAVDNVIGRVHTAVDHSGDVGGGDAVIDIDVPSQAY